MSDPTLSKEELNALLDGGAPKRERRVADYDLTRSSRLTADQLRLFQRLGEELGRRLSNELSAPLRMTPKVDLIGISETAFAAHRGALPRPSGIHVLTAAPLAEHALMTMDMKLLFSLIDRLLGGPGAPPAKPRLPTTLEQGLLDNLSRRCLEQFAGAWKTLLVFTPKVEALGFEPEKIEAIPTAETLVVTTFSISGGSELVGGELAFAMPLSALEGALAGIGKPPKFPPIKKAQSSVQRKHLDQVVGGSTLPLRVQLGTTTLSVGEVMAIKAGDVLVLDQATDALVDGQIAGRLRLRGRVGHSGRNLAVLVSQCIPVAATAQDGKAAK